MKLFTATGGTTLPGKGGHLAQRRGGSNNVAENKTELMQHVPRLTTRRVPCRRGSVAARTCRRDGQQAARPRAGLKPPTTAVSPAGCPVSRPPVPPPPAPAPGDETRRGREGPTPTMAHGLPGASTQTRSLQCRNTRAAWMKEKILSVNRALLEPPFSITRVCVLGTGQLAGEQRRLVSPNHPPGPVPGESPYGAAACPPSGPARRGPPALHPPEGVTQNPAPCPGGSGGPGPRSRRPRDTAP